MSRFEVPSTGSWFAMVLICAAGADATTIQVSTPIDEAVADNGNCTLREAILAANTNSVTDLCPAGSPGDADIVQLSGVSYGWSVASLSIGDGGPLTLRGAHPAVNPATVIIDPPSAERFLKLQNGADLTIEHLTIREGDATSGPNPPYGGALLVTNVDDVALTLRDVTFALNRAAWGGAVFFQTNPDCSACRLTIEGALFSGNVAEWNASLATVLAGGLYVQLGGDTFARITDAGFVSNAARSTFSGNIPRAAAFWAAVYDDASFELRRSTILSNSSQGVTDLTGSDHAVGNAVVFAASSQPIVLEELDFEGNDVIYPATGWPASALALIDNVGGFTLDRLRFYGNDWSEDAVDFRITHNSPAPASARNILVAVGSRRGAYVVQTGTGALELAHWTVTTHVDEELRLHRGAAAGELRLDNSIVWSPGSAVELVLESGLPAIDPESNLVGVNPLFVAPPSDFRLGDGSPAAEIADPAHAVGRLDLGHAPRVAGDAPDAGAYERDALFGDGFESADPGCWSSAAP